MENLRVGLDEYNSSSENFESVKQSVKKFLSRQRAGLMLGLADLGMKQGYFVDAFHLIGSNSLVINRAPYEIAMCTNKKKISNTYCFHPLLHEYLHALGYLDEEEVHGLVHEACSLASGKDQPATIMAERGIASYFPKVTYFSQEIPLPQDLNIEPLKDFDKTSACYIL